MSSWDATLRWLHQQAHLLMNSSNAAIIKKIAGAIFVILALGFALRKIQRAQHAEQRRATGNNANANVNVNAAPTPARPASRQSSTTPSTAVTDLSPISYLMPQKLKRTVCISTIKVFLSPTYTLSDPTVVPFLLALAQHTNLYLITHIPIGNGKAEDEAAYQSSIESRITTTITELGLLEAGLKSHRILFCTTSKGKSAILRHLEPHLAVDDDLDVLQSLRAFLPHLICIQPSLSTSTTTSSSTTPTFRSLTHFFDPSATSTSTTTSTSTSSSTPVTATS